MRKSIKFLFICHFVTVKPTYVAQWVHFDDLNRNSHTCQRSTIEIDEREKISRFHHCHVIFLYPEIFRRTKTNFLKICNEKIWNPFHSKVTRNILHNFLVLSSWHFGYFYTCCNAKSPKTFYFQLCNLIWHVWRGGGFKREILGFFIPFKPRYILFYQYRVMKQIVPQGYLGSDYMRILIVKCP